MNLNTELKKQKNTKWLVAGLMLFVLLLSVFILSQQSLRLDEAQSLFQTSHSLEGVIKIISEDVHVPLYHITLHYWQRIWGIGVFSARMLSLFFFILSIPVMYALGKLMYGRRIAFMATLLVALSPFLNWFGNEIRMYSMLLFFTLVNQYFFVRLYKNNLYLKIPPSKNDEMEVGKMWPLWLGYFFSALLGMYTHYFFFFALGAQAIFIMSYRKYFTRRSLFKFMEIATVLVISFVPWLYLVFQSDKFSYYQPILAKPQLVDVFNSFSQFMFGFHNDYTNTLVVSLWPLLAIFLFWALNKKATISQDAIYLFLTIVIPLLSVFVISLLLYPLFLARYFILIVPSIYLLISWVVFIYPEKISKAVQVLLVFVVASGLFLQIVNADTPVKEDYKAANEYLQTHTSAQDVVAVSPPFTIYPTEYYYTGPATIQTLPKWNRLEVGPIPQYSREVFITEVESIADTHERIWILVSFLNQGYEEEIVFYMDTNYERLEKIEFSPGLVLYAYKLRYDTPENLRAALERISRQ